MSDVRCQNIVVWLAVGTLLASCQSDAGTPSTVKSASTQTIEHAMGSAEVAVSPQRIVTLDTAPLDAALALSIKPVGTAIYGQLPEYLGERVSNIKIIGDGNQPNLETVLGLEPDLILGSKISLEEQYGRLSRIAPTVLTEGSGRAGDWQENFQLYAKALGQSEQAEQRLQHYQQNVQRLQEAIGQPQTIEMSVLIISGDSIRASTTGSFSGSVLQDVGFSRTPAQDDEQGYSLSLSPEALDMLDGDYIFLIHSTYRSGGVQKAEFMTHPVWSQLKAVQQGRVCEVTHDVWLAGRNILAANQILTDVRECLISGDEMEKSNRSE